MFKKIGLVIIAGLLIQDHDAQAVAALRSFTARVITVTTTATSVKNLVLAIPDTTVDSIDGKCNVTVICGANTTQVYLGGADVNTTTKYVPLCVNNVLSFGADGSWGLVWLKTASGTATVSVTISGGC